MLKHISGLSHSWGYIPSFLVSSDPTAKARDLFDKYYVGGWRPFKGFNLKIERAPDRRPTAFVLTYPGDPVQRVIAVGKFNDEYIVLFESEWVAIVQPDDSWEICRMD